MTSRYARWDGSQDPFGPDIPIDEAVGRLNEHLLEGWDAEWALRRLLEEGIPGPVRWAREPEGTARATAA